MNPSAPYFLLMRYFLLFLVLLSACSSGKEEDKAAKPPHFIREDKFVDITVDVRIAEAAIRHYAGYGEDTKKLSLYYYGKVWKKWGIDEKIYRENLEYYSRDPERLHQIYSRVTAELTEMKNRNSLRR